MKIIQKVLSNGLRSVIVPLKDNSTVTVMVLVETGSKYESDKEIGLSHFLEHMCFKGTDKRPHAMDISRELDGLGAQSNAFTSHEYTGYYAKGEGRHFKKLIDIISDVYLNSTFPEIEIEKEKGVIVEEINMYEDMPQRHVQDLFMSLLYPDQPAGKNIAGSRESVRSFSRNDFVSYHKKHYVPKATLVVVSGGIDPQKVENEVKRIFGTIAPSKKIGKKKIFDKQTEPAVKIKEKKTDQTHLVLGFRTFSVKNEKRNPAISVLSTILAGGMSSRLFEKLREEMGVCYYVRASNDIYTDHGYFEISVGCDTKRVQEVIGVILSECIKMKTHRITEQELSKVKEYMLGNMLLELESSDAYANFYGSQAILRRTLRNPKEVERIVRNVTAKEIQQVAKQIFKDNRLNLAMIGPFTKSEEKAFKKLLHV
ncbi:MAG: insulinase family protein [Candidatus Pacebacteria bacterium]|nr:insulinase family protein [Candidatus Paceibacterota bacterium]